VADHTTGVALLTLALAGAINAAWQRGGVGTRPIDAGRAVHAGDCCTTWPKASITDLPKRSAQLLGSAEQACRAETCGA
jgi:hypothetical protein